MPKLKEVDINYEQIVELVRQLEFEKKIALIREVIKEKGYKSLEIEKEIAERLRAKFKLDEEYILGTVLSPFARFRLLSCKTANDTIYTFNPIASNLL